MPKVSCLKSQKLWLRIRQWWKLVFFLYINFTKTFLWTRRMHFWWPSHFFCQKPQKHQLKFRKWWKKFFSFKKISAGIEGSLSSQPKKGIQKSEKLLLIVQKWRNWWKLRSLCLQQDILDTQVSVLTFLPTGSRDTPALFVAWNAWMWSAHFKQKFHPKNSFCAREIHLWKTC